MLKIDQILDQTFDVGLVAYHRYHVILLSVEEDKPFTRNVVPF